MMEFAYTARTLNGQDVSGTVSAESRRDVLSLLTDRNLCPIAIENPRQPKSAWSFQSRPSGEVLAATLTQLSDLLHNGVPLLKSLELLSEQATHATLKHVLGDVRKRVAEGAPLYEALATHSNVFDELTISIVRAGTEGAFLEDALEQTAGFLDLQEQVRGRIKSAMAYPAFLAAAGSLVTLVLIVFFVPKFAELFDQLEQAGTLPGATIALLWLSDTLGRFGILIGIGCVGIVYAIRRWAAGPAGRKAVDRWKLKLPMMGPLFLNTAVARFCRILGTLLRNGVPLLKALEISSDSAGNVQLAEAIRSSAENVSTGETLSEPLARCGLIPRNVMAMIAIAEESNNLDGVLNNIADNVDRKTARQLDMLVRLVEPALLMVMGSAVLFVIVALLLPVFEMSTSMG